MLEHADAARNPPPCRAALDEITKPTPLGLLVLGRTRLKGYTINFKGRKLLHCQWKYQQSAMNVVTDQSEQLGQLARRVDDLIALTELLTRKRALRAQQQQWSHERAKPIEKNQTATTSVEAMITRLKSLERG